MGTQVIIGCKLPNGLIIELVEQPQQKNSIIPAPVGKRVKLNGANTLSIVRTNPALQGHGETKVDEDFWNEWFKRNKDAAFITSGAIFMVKTADAFVSESKERLAIRTNLEPLDARKGTKDPRMNKGIERNPDAGFIDGSSPAVA